MTSVQTDSTSAGEINAKPTAAENHLEAFTFSSFEKLFFLFDRVTSLLSLRSRIRRHKF
jgi:hypothetical protein